jgi:hypothetical protein
MMSEEVCPRCSYKHFHKWLNGLRTCGSCYHVWGYKVIEESVNAPLPGQLTVGQLREALKNQQENALVCVVEYLPQQGNIYHALRVSKADGGPTVQLEFWSGESD